MGSYVFDNAWEKERERLSALERYYDPGTINVISSLGIEPGWTCLEVAGGGGSMARWLARRVAPSGRVMATDLDTRFLEALGEENIDVRRHDITADELPEETFDLVHARLLLEHLPDRGEALKRLVASLRPGGWIVIEDMDWGTLLCDPPIASTYPESNMDGIPVGRALVAAMQQAGYDATYGRRLPGELVALGLADVDAEGRDNAIWGGTPEAVLRRWTLERVRPAMTALGTVTDADIDREIARLSDPSNMWRGVPIVAAWGRKRGVAEPSTKQRTILPVPEESTLDRLRRVRLFARCTQAEIEQIARSVRSTSADAGQELTHEGATTSSLFIIDSGTATVSRGGRELARLGPGSFFGEMATLTSGTRTATVKADGPMRLYELDAESFRRLVAQSPSVSAAITQALAERLQQTNEALSTDEPSEYPRFV